MMMILWSSHKMLWQILYYWHVEGSEIVCIIDVASSFIVIFGLNSDPALSNRFLLDIV